MNLSDVAMHPGGRWIDPKSDVEKVTFFLSSLQEMKPCMLLYVVKALADV